jgi:hypothetical protein
MKVRPDEIGGKAKPIRRGFSMRNHLLVSALSLAATLACSLALPTQTPAQTTDQPGMGRSAATPADLSGLWIRLRDPSHASINLDFGKAISPMTPWGEAKFKAANSVYRSSSPSTVLSDPIFNCFPPGVPRIYMLNFPVQIVQVPGQVIMLFEFDHFVRRIYTDGRPHDKDVGQLWMGDSIGKWEGDTLVADTVSFNDKTTFDREGYPHSNALHLVERIRRIDHDNLSVDLTVDDPKTYTKPWNATLNFQLRPDWKIMEHVCEDNTSFLDFNKKSTQTPKKK